ncbi:hypothetical protein [Rhodococcus gannanensis]|uniref:Uncharacterized protein n=1 Tax=Rhodococcus gannanensis TaxID=1960308 RepID=A0ABW4P1D4_9NOCA
MGDVLCDFVEVERDGCTRRMLLDGVIEAAAYRVVRHVTLDVFNVMIDGGSGVVVIGDELDVSRSEQISVETFETAIGGW